MAKVSVAAPTAIPGETILLAEDEHIIQQMLCRYLDQLGYTVVCASDGQEAEELYSQAPSSYDLILSDVVMPRRSGPEFVSQIRSLTPQQPVLYISGYTSTCTSGCAFAAFPQEQDVPLLPKPFGLQRLAERVRETLERARAC